MTSVLIQSNIPGQDEEEEAEEGRKYSHGGDDTPMIFLVRTQVEVRTQ